ncbi:MAG: DUF2145 domain-containing protein [Pseudomonadota bacterium]
MRRFISAILLALVTALPPMAFAGSRDGSPPVLPAGEVATFADRVQQDLAARGARVAIVARTGRDPADLPPGIQYTHVSYWVYSDIVDSDGRTGRGYRVYNLYQEAGAPNRSRLVQDGPADFFAGAHRLDAGIIVPDIRLQRKLLDVIASPTYAALHNANYAVLANPRSDRFQNCTEHTLDVLMASLYGTSDVRQIKANIGAHFQPQEIRLGGMKRLLAPVASQDLTTADHGGAVATATFGSIARFMRANDLASEVVRITPRTVARF